MKSSTALQARNDREQLLRMYDQREWDAADARSPWALKYRARLASVLGLLLAETRPGDVVLEVGSGQANCSLLLAEQQRVAVALDVDPRTLAYGLRKYERGEFHPVAGEAGALPLAEGSCRAVVAMELLEHLPDPPRALGEMARVLAPGGVLVLSAPNSRFVHERLPEFGRGQREPMPAALDAAGHWFAFSLARLRRLTTDAGLRVEHAGYVGSVFFSDRNPGKRLLTAGQITGLSRWLNRLPGARFWSYTCWLMARKPMGSTANPQGGFR